MFSVLSCISCIEDQRIFSANSRFAEVFGTFSGKKSYEAVTDDEEFARLYCAANLTETTGWRMNISQYVKTNTAVYIISTLIPWQGGRARLDLFLEYDIDIVSSYDRMMRGEGSENDVGVKCFGSFEICTVTGRVTATDFASPQCCTMLAYLLTNSHRDVSIQELGDVLWPSQQVQSPYNMIKNIVLRTRRVLERVSDKPFIVINNGIYGINPELKVVMETDVFEKACQRADEPNLTNAQRETACRKALVLYGGTLFPTMADEPWLTARSAYYQMLYTDCVLTLMRLLEARRDRLAMYRVAADAARNIFHDGTVQFELVMSEMRIGNVAQARALYVNSEPLFSDEQKKKYQAAMEKLDK